MSFDNHQVFLMRFIVGLIGSVAIIVVGGLLKLLGVL